MVVIPDLGSIIKYTTFDLDSTYYQLNHYLTINNVHTLTVISYANRQ